MHKKIKNKLLNSIALTVLMLASQSSFAVTNKTVEQKQAKEVEASMASSVTEVATVHADNPTVPELQADGRNLQEVIDKMNDVIKKLKADRDYTYGEIRRIQTAGLGATALPAGEPNHAQITATLNSFAAAHGAAVARAPTGGDPAPADLQNNLEALYDLVHKVHNGIAPFGAHGTLAEVWAEIARLRQAIEEEIIVKQRDYAWDQIRGAQATLHIPGADRLAPSVRNPDQAAVKDAVDKITAAYAAVAAGGLPAIVENAIKDLDGVVRPYYPHGARALPGGALTAAQSTEVLDDVRVFITAELPKAAREISDADFNAIKDTIHAMAEHGKPGAALAAAATINRAGLSAYITGAVAKIGDVPDNLYNGLNAAQAGKNLVELATNLKAALLAVHAAAAVAPIDQAAVKAAADGAAGGHVLP